MKSPWEVVKAKQAAEAQRAEVQRKAMWRARHLRELAEEQATAKAALRAGRKP